MYIKSAPFSMHLSNVLRLSIVIILFTSQTAFCQSYKDPVSIYTEEVYEKGVDFIVDNTSYYPFTVKLIYSELENLGPSQTVVEKIVTNGRRTVHSLRIVVPEAGYSYKFDVSSIVGSEKLVPERDFIYLVPLSPGCTSEPSVTNNLVLVNSFRTEPGDTIFCSRKGVIAAVAGEDSNDFRISEKSSFEVMHDDGTVLIYYHVNNNSFNLHPGMTVFPGDPIGIAESKGYILLRLLWLNGTRRFEDLPILYAGESNEAVLYKSKEGHLLSVHPENLITKEMTEKEIKKRNKKLSGK